MGQHNGVPVPCACGCDGTVISPDKWGRKHQWKKGHHRKGKPRPEFVGNQFARLPDERAGYAAAHYRVRVARGYAREHDCVDCGEQASDWSYKQDTGYSTDVEDYDPRCRGCHIKYDRGLAWSI